MLFPLFQFYLFPIASAPLPSLIFSTLTTAVIFPSFLNPLNPELNPICYLLALLLGAHYFLHVSRIRVKLLTLGY